MFLIFYIIFIRLVNNIGKRDKINQNYIGKRDKYNDNC